MKNSGFTLIELIIYVAIISAVLFLMTGFLWDIVYGGARTMSYREVQQNTRFAMKRITKAIRAGQNPTTTFTVSSNILYQGAIPLTTDQVKVTNLQFTSVSNTYKVYLSLECNDISTTLWSTVAPRQ